MEMNYQEFEARFPSVFGDWHIVRKLGKGSYCDVYEVCKQTGSIIERKALKHISFPRDPYELQAICSELGTSDAAVVRDYIHQSVEVFEKEYQIMSDLGGQTNTVSCQDIRKIDKRDMPGYDIFFFMELLQTVANVSRERTFTEDEVVHLGIDICKALELLEKKSLIHRDIKPENLFINSNGDYKLGDFGAARLVSGVQSIVTSKGTPAYMPPEIVRMMPAGPFSDIYSLGLVMYRLLNNNMPPFSEDSNSASTTSFEVASGKRLTGEKLPKPANGSKGLVSVVLKACEYEPTKRYQKATQMREALEAVRAEMEKNKENSKKAPKKVKEEKTIEIGTAPGNKEEDNIRRISMTPAEIARMEEEKRLQEEREKKEKEKKELQKREERWKKIRKVLIATMVAAVVLAAAGVCVKLISDSQKKKNEYKAAITLLEGGKYDEAQAAFALIDDAYEDAAAKKKEIKDKLDAREDELNNAKAKAEEENYADAIKTIRNMYNQFPEDRHDELDSLLSDYMEKLQAQKEHNEQIAQYDEILKNAQSMLEQKDKIDDVITTLEELEKVYPTKEVDDTYQRAVNMRDYYKGEALLAEGHYEDAIVLFTELGSYEDAEDRIREAKDGISINKAKDELKKENYDEVLKLLNNITSEEARSIKKLAETGQTNEKSFNEALGYMDEARKKLQINEKDYDNAIEDYRSAQTIFKNLGRYVKKGDSSLNRRDECTNWIDYLSGKEKLDEGDYSQARNYFSRLVDVSEDGFEDSAALVQLVDQKAKKKEADESFEKNDLDNAEKKYNELKALGDVEGADKGLAQVSNMRKYIAAQDTLNEGLKGNSNEMLGVAKQAFLELGTFNGANEKAQECDNAIQYVNGLQLMKDEKYEEAKKIFTSLGEYKDAEKLGNRADTLIKYDEKYLDAKEKMEYQSYEKARDIFKEIKGYKDANELAEKCQNYVLYGDAQDFIAEGETKFDNALKILNDLTKKGFSGAQERIDEINQYKKAGEQLDAGNYQEALDIYSKLNEFPDLQKRIQKCEVGLKYLQAKSIMENDPATAYNLFAETIEYHPDSMLLREKCSNKIAYQKALAEKEKNNYEEAYNQFKALSLKEDDDSDSAAQAALMWTLLQNQRAKKAADAGRYEEAIDYLIDLNDDNSRALLTSYRYELAKEYQKDKKYDKALSLYNQILSYSDSQKQADECKYELYCIEMLSDGGTMDEFKARCFRFIYFYNGYTDKKGWGNSIIRQPQSAIETPLSFATSVYSINIPMSSTDKVNALYQIMLGRNLDDGGKRFITALDNGMTMYYVLSEIQESTEFRNRCSIFGVDPGEKVALTNARDRNPYLTGYVYRCYKYLLGRAPSNDELDKFCDDYLNGKVTISGIIKLFINSKEFKSKNLSSEQYIDSIYHAVLDRGPDSTGKERGKEYFKLGHTKEEYLEVILSSKEYIQNLNKQKLIREGNE